MIAQCVPSRISSGYLVGRRTMQKFRTLHDLREAAMSNSRAPRSRPRWSSSRTSTSDRCASARESTRATPSDGVGIRAGRGGRRRGSFREKRARALVVDLLCSSRTRELSRAAHGGPTPTAWGRLRRRQPKQPCASPPQQDRVRESVSDRLCLARIGRDPARDNARQSFALAPVGTGDDNTLADASTTASDRICVSPASDT